MRHVASGLKPVGCLERRLLETIAMDDSQLVRHGLSRSSIHRQHGQTRECHICPAIPWMWPWSNRLVPPLVHKTAGPPRVTSWPEKAWHPLRKPRVEVPESLWTRKSPQEGIWTTKEILPDRGMVRT